MKSPYSAFALTDEDWILPRLDHRSERVNGSLHGVRSLADDLLLRMPHPLGYRAMDSVAKLATYMRTQSSLRSAGSDCASDPLTSFARLEAPHYMAEAPAYTEVVNDSEILGQHQRSKCFRQGMLVVKQTRYTVAPRGYRLSDFKFPIVGVENLVNVCQVVTFISEEDGVCFKLTALGARQNITQRGHIVWETLNLSARQGRVGAVDSEGTGPELEIASAYSQVFLKAGPSRFRALTAKPLKLASSQQELEGTTLNNLGTQRVALIRPSLVPFGPGRIAAREFTGGHLGCIIYCANMTLVDLTIRTGLAHLYERCTRRLSKQRNIHCVIPADTNRRGKFHFVARPLSPRNRLATHGIEAGNVLLFYGFADFDLLRADNLAKAYNNKHNVIIRNEPLIHTNNHKSLHLRFRALPSAQIDLDAVSNTTVGDNAFELDPKWTTLRVELGRDPDVVSLTYDRVLSPENPLSLTPTYRSKKPWEKVVSSSH